MTTAARIARRMLAALALGALTGCAAALDPSIPANTLEAVFGDGDWSNKALGALQRGDYPAAERYALVALRRDPKDPHGLLVAGMAYQATNRPDIARQYYEVIVTNDIQGLITLPGEGGAVAPRSVVDVAKANLLTIDRMTGRSVPRSSYHSGKSVSALPDGQPQVIPGLGGSQFGYAPAPGSLAAMAPGVVGKGQASDAELNMAARFRILKKLSDAGLITPEEYSRRRSANLGALTPLTQPPPSTGLDRPVPADENVIDRLRALAAALEARGVGAREYQEERAVILDALLPSQPRRAELPALPPRDMIEAAAAVGRIERMRAAGLLSTEEATRERAAVDKGLDAQLAQAPVQAGAVSGLRRGNPPPYAAPKPGQPSGNGVLLATLKTEAAAHKAWETAKAKFPEQLGTLQGAIQRVELGEKGTRWRVVAGPLADKAEAKQLCKTLKLHRQSCEPAAF